MTVFVVGLAATIAIGCSLVLAYDLAAKRWGAALERWWNQ